LLQQLLASLGVLGPDEDFQQVVQVAFDAFTQQEAVVAWQGNRITMGNLRKAG
jgi:hypothetical protein